MDYINFILSLIGTFFVTMTMSRLGQILALGVIVSLGIAIWKIHTNKENPVDLAELFIDNKTRLIDGSKLRMNLAFFVTSWVIVFATLNATVSEWMLGAYLAAWVTDRYNSRNANITKEPKSESDVK